MSVEFQSNSGFVHIIDIERADVIASLTTKNASLDTISCFRQGRELNLEGTCKVFEVVHVHSSYTPTNRASRAILSLWQFHTAKL